MSKPAIKKLKDKIAAEAALDTMPAAEAAPIASQAPMIWAIAFSAGAALLVLSTIVIVIRTYTPLPKWDHWAEILWLRYYYAGQWQISDLWRQHNEHRILFPRLFLWTDWFYFQGRNIFVLCCILLLQAGHAWIFIREIRLWKELSAAVRLTVISIVVVLFFSGANLDNFTWPFQISFILSFYAGTVSLYALIRYAEKIGKRKARLAGAGWFAAAVGSGIVATYSLSNGILLWPVLLLTGFVLRVSRRALLTIGVIGGLAIAQYFYGYHLIAGHGNAIDALKHPIAVLSFIGAYLAIPVARVDHLVGAIVGLALLAASAWTAFRMLHRRPLPRLMILSMGVMLYITATAVITAMGRLAVATPEASLRYATPVSIFWACALLLGLSEAETFRPNPAVAAAVLATAITGLIVTIVPMHAERCAAFLQLADTIRVAEVAVRSDVDAKVQIAAIYPDPEFAFSLIDVLRTHQRSIFANTAELASGTQLPSEYLVVKRDSCRGTWELTASLENASRPGASVSGWAWDNVANRRPERIVFMDDGQYIRGFAAFTRTREDVAAAFRNTRMTSSGWYGFAQGIPGLRAYALLSDGRSLCPLNNASEVSGPMIALFRKSQWMFASQKNGHWEPERSFYFGFPDDIPVTGDWDGSGVIRAGVYRKGQWFLDLNNNGRWDEGDRQIFFGLPDDLPVVGDWNHSGVTKVGVFRKGTWILDWKGEQRFGSGARQFTFGAAGDLPVVGDWDGSGVTRIGVYRRGEWFLDNGDFQLDSRDQTAAFGLPGDQPVTGNWNGLGLTKIGVFRNGQWILDIDGKRTWDPQDGSIPFGLPGDVAIPWKK